MFLLRRRDLAVFIVLIPFVFNWFMLYLGITAIDTPEIPFGKMPPTAWNGRVGLEMLPAAAFFVAVVFRSIASSEIRRERHAGVAVSAA